MADALHIAHVVLSLDTGGLERVVVELIRHSRRLGRTVSVICLERPGTFAPEAEALGARIVCINKRSGLRLGTGGRIAAVLRELRPDVVHTHQVGALFYTGRAARALGIPVIVHTEQNNNLQKHGATFWRRQRMTWLWWWAARYARKFFCVSADISAELAARRLVPEHKLAVVHNAINTAPFREPIDRTAVRADLGIPADAPVIGTVGRLNEVKRQDLLLRAFAAVRARVPGTRLLIVGDGPERAGLEALAGRLGIAGAVCFVGYQAKPGRFLGVMDVFAQTSRMEGLPLAVLEAWAAGLPVIASAVGGVPDLVTDGQNGLLFPAGDESAITGLLGELLDDPARRRALADAGRDEVMRRYDLQRMAAEYDDHYQTLLGRPVDPLAVAQ